MTKVPISAHEQAWIAYGAPGTGMVIFDGKDFTAERSLKSYLSALGKGRRGAMGSPKDGKGNMAPEIFLLAAVRSKEVAPGFAKRCRLAFFMTGAMDEFDWEILQNADEFDAFAGAWFVNLVRDTGNGLEIAAKWLDAIETKIRPMTDHEDDFMRSVVIAAEDCGDVPTKAAVREIWLGMDCDRAEESFDFVRDALGFDWLPKGRAGRKGGC